MTMADEPKSLDVYNTLRFREDGWQFLSYDRNPDPDNPTVGFLLRDAGQIPNHHRLEILFWRPDRAQDDTQLVLDGETGNLGIGATSPTDKLTIRGGALAFQPAGQDQSEMGIDYDATSQSLRIRARTHAANGLDNDVLTIKQDGKVCIGTTTADAALNVGGSLRIDGDLNINTSKKIYLRDKYHGIGYSWEEFASQRIDGPVVFGYRGGALGCRYLDGGKLPEKVELEKVVLAWTQEGNVGIGKWPTTERLEVEGTVKATAFEGSGAGITGIKASNITSETLAADRVPSLDRLNGQLPVEKTSGQLPVERVSGNLPLERTSGALSIDRITGNLPIARTTGNLPAARIDGVLSQWTTSGANINYGNGKVIIGALPQSSGTIDATKRAASEAAQATQALNDGLQGWLKRLRASNQFSSNERTIDPMPWMGPIQAATNASSAAADAVNQGATPVQIIQATSRAGKQAGNAAEQAQALSERVKNDFYNYYYKYGSDVSFGTDMATWNELDSLDISRAENPVRGLISNARQKSIQAQEQGQALATSIGTTKFLVTEDSFLAGNLLCWGDFFGNGKIQAANSDLAENYLSAMDLAAADVVCLDQSQDRIILSDKANDPLVIGVVSSAPGFLLNAPGEANKSSGTLAYPVALCGRVPCKVTDENGPIHRGDLLTSSSTPGHAMKATTDIYRPGTIIGKALEALPAGKGIIEVFVTLR
jgi:hypothetical protein